MRNYLSVCHFYTQTHRKSCKCISKISASVVCIWHHCSHLYCYFYTYIFFFHTYLLTGYFSGSTQPSPERYPHFIFCDFISSSLFKKKLAEDPGSDLETSVSAWIGLQAEKLNFCIHFCFIQRCYQKQFTTDLGGFPTIALLRQLVTQLLGPGEISRQ